MGFNDEEACLYAGISARSLYTYIEKNPEFSQKKNNLSRIPK